MTIYESQLANLRGFGYTEVEARFLYLVATHSGYFTVPQFLSFAVPRAASGTPASSRNFSGWAMPGGSAIRGEASFTISGPAKFTRRSAKRISEIVGTTNLRTSRSGSWRSITSSLTPKTYFETTEEKRRIFTQRLGLNESLFLRSTQAGITLTDRFPLCIAYPAPDYMPVVTFTYVDPEHRDLDRYIPHLRTYRPLFRQLPTFQFV